MVTDQSRTPSILKEVCFRAERQKQMIELEFEFAVRNASYATDSPRVQINGLNIGIDKLHMTKNAPKRIHDVARIKIAAATSCSIGVKRMKFSRLISVTSTSARRASRLSKCIAA
jgi:hypothetical protein